MEKTIINYRASYEEFKLALDNEMQKTVEGFVKIGFLLNYAAESNILETSGYVNVNDFAKSEYGIDATQVSRFVNIYKRFGVSGEPRLKDQYVSHGVAKLGIMLTLPDYINEEIGSEYSKSEINAIKHEIEEEEKISDIEVMCEEKSVLQTVTESTLASLVLKFAEDFPQEFVKLYDAISIEDVKEIMAPNKVATYKVRIPGTGLMLMFVKATENITVSNTRTGEKHTYSWEAFFEELREMFINSIDAKEQWSIIFLKPFPEETPNTANPHNDNVQQSKQAPKKESKVKIPKNDIKKEKNVSKEAENELNNDEQLPGQDSILNHPEYLPEDMKEEMPEVLTGEVVDIENTANPHNDNVQQADEGMKVEHFAPVQNNDTANIIRGYKSGIRTALTIMEDKYEQGDWSSVYVKASDIAFRAKKIMELEGKNGKKSE